MERVMEAWGLFLDDERQPISAGSFFSSPTPVVVRVARSVDEAIELLGANGVPSRISFDHDLGPSQPTAMAFMRYIIDAHLDKKLDLSAIEKVQVHSANPVGAENLIYLWNSFAQAEKLSARAERHFV
jgi:hypothetical protein